MYAYIFYQLSIVKVNYIRTFKQLDKSFVMSVNRHKNYKSYCARVIPRSWKDVAVYLSDW